MYRFHATLHARPAGARIGETHLLASRSVVALAVRPEDFGVPLNVSFEEASEALAALPRMFCEPDGSFVWVSAASEPQWQVEGCLYDRAGRLLYVELWGACPAEEFDRLLAAFGWPRTPLVFQLVREAVALDENGFRKWAEFAWLAAGNPLT